MKEIRLSDITSFGEQDDLIKLELFDWIDEAPKPVKIFESAFPNPEDDSRWWMNVQVAVLDILAYKYPGVADIFYRDDKKCTLCIEGLTAEDFKKARKDLGLSQCAFADRLKEKTGTGSRELVQKIEAGKTPAKKPICMGVSYLFEEYLLAQKDQPERWAEYFNPKSDVNQGRTYRRCLFDPRLPDHFYNLDINERCAQEIEQWHGQPFIETQVNCDPETGPYIHYTLYCLDGGAWDRPTNRFRSTDLEEVIQAIEESYPDKLL